MTRLWQSAGNEEQEHAVGAAAYQDDVILCPARITTGNDLSIAAKLRLPP